MQIICTLLQTDNHARTSPLSFYRPDGLPAANQQRQKFKALKALKANETKNLTNFRHEPQHNNLHCHSTVQANVHVDNRNWELTC